MQGDELTTTRTPTEPEAKAETSTSSGPGAATSQHDEAREDEAREDEAREDEAREARLARFLWQWWLDERPAWTEPDWWDAPLRDEVRSLIWLPAGPLLVTALGSIERTPRCSSPHEGEGLPGLPAPGHSQGWPCACMVAVAAAWEACTAWVAAGSAMALVDAAGPTPLVLDIEVTRQSITDPAREELALALRTSPNSMGNRITSARDLVAHPRLVGLIESAAISAWAARLVVLELADLTPEDARAVVDQVCTRIGHRTASGRRSWTSAEVGRAARMARRRICPDSDRPARERAFARRRVHVFGDKNGMATLVADLDETDAHRIHRRLTALARGVRADDDSRNCDQIRADVLVDLLLGPPGLTLRDDNPSGPSGEVTAATHSDAEPSHVAADAPGPGRVTRHARGHNGVRPEIQVVVSLETLAGLADDPAELTGLGPIPAEIARELAADGRWRAWVTDASGAVVATGSLGYIPSSGLARAVRAREPHCRMPGCRASSVRCDLDHMVPYPEGATSAANLGPLCRRHHVLKTHVGWDLEPADYPAAARSGSGAAAEADRGTGTGTGSNVGPVLGSWPGSGSARTPSPGQDEATAPEEATTAPSPPAWRWRTPAGFTVADHPSHPLE
ncbi:MAG: DUF222 domain-containing protein [Candidatus Nanopelagicales bacterium]